MKVSFTNSGSHGLFHKDCSRKEILKVCVTKDVEKFQNVDGIQIVEANKVLNGQRDDLSCISKADASNTMVAGHRSETERKNVSCSSSSVNSVFPEGLESSVQSDKHCPDNAQSILEEGNTDSGRQNQCSEEAVRSTVNFSDKSDPCETSSSRERAAARPMQKGESAEWLENQRDSSPVRPVSSSADAPTLKCDARCCDDNSLKWKGSAADRNQPAPDAKSSFDNKEHSTMNVSLDLPIDRPLHLQSPAVEKSGGSDELVDVRVCDICGDAGREALLAICSKCNDGAEHIYCMQIKMHKVPEGDWMCEECVMMQETQAERFPEHETLAGALKSPARKIVHKSGKLDCRAKLSEKNISPTLCFSGKRTGSSIKFSPADKRRAVENRELSGKLSVSSRRTVLPQALSPKIMDKGKTQTHLAHLGSTGKVAMPCSSMGTKSSGVETKSPERSLSKIQPLKSSDMKIHPWRIHIPEKRKISEVTVTCRSQRNATFDKLRKSISFNGVGKACLDVSDSKTKNNDLRHKTEQKAVQRICSFKTDRSKTYQPLRDIGAAKLTISPRTAVSRQVKPSPSLLNKGHVGKVTEVSGSSNMSKPSISRHYKGPSQAKGTATHGRKKRQSSSQAGGRSPGHAKTVISSHQLTTHPQIICTEDSAHPVPTENVLQTRLPSIGDLPLFNKRKDAFPGVSVGPKLTYIWRGLFKLEEGEKLPSHCHGIQAHLSTSASPRVSDIVLKFSHALLLKEFPRMDNWPVHFQKTGPKEEDIALYFFAEDLHSFKSYKRMVECMVQNDLALKGSVDGLELFILPSNLLPQNSQRWNNFYFLWGVFIARKATCPGYLSVSGPQETCQVPNSSGVNIGKESSVPIVCGLQHMSPVPIDGGLHPTCSLPKPNQEPDMTNMVELQSSASPKCMSQICEVEVCSPPCEVDVCSQKKCFGSVEAFDCSPDAIEGIPPLGTLTKRDHLSGGMQHANDSQKQLLILGLYRHVQSHVSFTNHLQLRECLFTYDGSEVTNGNNCSDTSLTIPETSDKSRYLNHELGDEISNQAIKREISYIPNDVGGYKEIKVHPIRKDNGNLFESMNPLYNTRFPWMKDSAPAEETFKQEKQDSVYRINGINAIENLQTKQGFFSAVPGASVPVNTGGLSWVNEWQVELGENSTKRELSILNLAFEDRMGNGESDLNYRSSDPVARYEGDNGGVDVSLELSLALPCSSKDQRFPDVDTSLVL